MLGRQGLVVLSPPPQSQPSAMEAAILLRSRTSRTLTASSQPGPISKNSKAVKSQICLPITRLSNREFVLELLGWSRNRSGGTNRVPSRLNLTRSTRGATRIP